VSTRDWGIVCEPNFGQRFIFDGIGGLVEHLLVSNSRLIRFANDFGIQKMLRNLSALRQNLKTITGLPEDSELSQAQAYYNLFSLGPTVCVIFVIHNKLIEEMLVAYA
jgi:exocyst complex component 4